MRKLFATLIATVALATGLVVVSQGTANATSYGGAVGQTCGVDICAFIQTWVNTRADTNGDGWREVQAVTHVTCRRRTTNVIDHCRFIDAGAYVERLYRKENSSGGGGGADLLVVSGPGRLNCRTDGGASGLPDCPGSTYAISATAFVPLFGSGSWDMFAQMGLAGGELAQVQPQASAFIWEGIPTSGKIVNVV